VKKKNIRIVVLIAIVAFVCIGLGIYKIGTAIYHYSLTHISMTDTERNELWNAQPDGYGFPYENGWSSVDLWPYHVENEENTLVRLEAPSSFIVNNAEDMPILDGAEAAYPVYSAFALNCYKDIATIQSDSTTGTAPIRFTNTIEAYKKLLSGEIDIFFGAQPSEKQKQMAKAQNKELKLTPIAQEGFIFFVSKDNAVDDLSSQQIRSIYSGEYTNWKAVGGENIPILAFQRPENSGSQTMMQYFMGDTELKEPLQVEWADGMGTVLKKVANYQNKKSAIGYSFRYYATKMENSYQDDIKLLSVDGVYPTAENIANGKYPITTTLYAITLADNPKASVTPFLEWMQSEQGQAIIEKTGYVVVNNQ